MLQHVHLEGKLKRRLGIEISGEGEPVETFAAGVRVIELAVEELDGEAEWRGIVEVVQHPHFGRVVEQTVAAAHAGLATARTCWKWPILREGAFSCSAIRPVPAPRFGSLAHSRAPFSVSPLTSARLANCQAGSAPATPGSSLRA